MDAWDGRPFARLYMLLVALAFAAVGLQVLLFHWRGGFRRLTTSGSPSICAGSPGGSAASRFGT